MSRFRRYISSHGASIQKTKLFLERESSRLVERQAALRAAQTSSSQDPNQEGGVTEEMMRNLQQVGRSATYFLLRCDDRWDRVDLKLPSLVLSGGQKCGGAAADGSERKLSPAEEGGATPAARELHGWRGEEKTSACICRQWYFPLVKTIFSAKDFMKSTST